MRAVRFHDFSGLDGLRLEEVSTPAPRQGEILVRIRAAGVNPFDWYAPNGWVNDFVTFDLPTIVGRDFSGVVESVGDGAEGIAVADEVFGHADAAADGTFADYVVVPATRVARKPAGLSHIEAASLPNVLMAAWDGLFSSESGMDLAPGQTVLVHGAAGGIGSIAVQLARWRGAHVIGVASARNQAFLHELGVSDAISYETPDWHRAIPMIDGVLDTTAGDDAGLLCSHIRPRHSYVALRGLPPEDVVAAQRASGVRCVVASGPASEHLFHAMADAVAAGAARPVVSKTFPVVDFRAALDEVSRGHVRGKLVLEIDGQPAE